MIELRPEWLTAGRMGLQKNGVSGGAGTRFAALFQKASEQPAALDGIFAQAAETYQVPENLLRAIGYHESRYQPEVVSRCGAMGVMQLMPDTARAMGVADPFNPEQNIMGGAKLLSQLLRKYDGDLKLTLAAYGAGSGAVAKYDGIPPYQETQNFVNDIMAVVNKDYVAPPGATSDFMDVLNQMNGFSGFTAEDYRLFLQSILAGMQQSDDWSGSSNDLFWRSRV